MLLFILPLLYLKNKYFFNRNIVNIIIILILYIFYQIDLQMLFGRNVYFSDAEYYWNLYINRDISNYSRYFILYIYITNIFGLFNSIALFSINNIVLHITAVILVSELLKKYYLFSDKQLKKIERKILLNGIILFMVYRSIKDMLFVFLSISLIYIYYEYFNKKKIIIFIILFIIVSYFLPQIRPWSFALPIILILFHYLLKSYKKYKYLTIIIAIIISSIIITTPLFLKYLNILKYLNEMHEESEYLKGETGLFNFIKSFLIFIFGPGPKRALLGSTYFQFYTNIGNILILCGVLQWYYNLSKFILNIINNQIQLINFMNIFFVFGVVLITVYAISYSGSAETRLRACLYYYFLPFISIFNKNCKRKINYKYIIIILILFAFINSIL